MGFHESKTAASIDSLRILSYPLVITCYNKREREEGNAVLFSWYVIAYLFLAGAGSGAFLVAAVCCMVDAAMLTPRTARLAAAVQPAFVLAPVLVALAVIFLFFDLGSPEKVGLLLLNPLQSVMSVGAWMVSLLLAVSTALAIIGAVAKASRMFQMACMVAGSVLAVGTMAYTGLLLSSLPSVDFWSSGWLVALFVASSLSCGTAVIVGADAILHGSPEGTSRGPWKLAGWLAVAETAVLACFIASRQLAGGTALQAVQQLTLGELAPAFWLLVVGAGLLAPGILHATAGRRVPLRIARISGALGTLAGGLALRYCIVAAATVSPLSLTIIQVLP